MDALTTSAAGVRLGKAFRGLLRVVMKLLGVEARRREREAAAEAALILRRATPLKSGVDTSQIRESLIFSYQVTDRSGVPLGTLKIWYDAETRVARRELTLVHPGLEAALGSRRLPLEPRRLPTADSIPTLREVSLREVEEMLRRKFGGDLGARVQSAADAPTPAALPPAAAKERAAPPKAVRARAAQVQQVDEGILQNYGWDTRTIPNNEDPEGGVRTIEHFFVDVELTNSDNPGQIKRVWGADLERAIKAAAPREGDSIRIKHLGRMPVSGRDGDKRRVYKNCYDIELIGAKR